MVVTLPVTLGSFNNWVCVHTVFSLIPAVKIRQNIIKISLKELLCSYFSKKFHKMTTNILIVFMHKTPYTPTPTFTPASYFHFVSCYLSSVVSVVTDGCSALYGVNTASTFKWMCQVETSRTEKWSKHRSAKNCSSSNGHFSLASKKESVP